MTIRAKFEVSTEIAKVCDAQASRYALSALHVIPGPDSTVYVSATDARILAVNCVDGAADGEQLVPAELIAKGSTKDPKRVELNGRLEVSTGRGAKAKTVIGDGEVTGRFPSLPDVFPNVSSADGFRVLTLDAKALAKLAAAVSTDGKVSILIGPAPERTALNPDADTTEITSALPVLGDVGFGLCMPCVGNGRVIKIRDDETGAVTVKTEADVKTERFRERAARFSECFREARAAREAAQREAEELKKRAESVAAQ